jgi:hypothetical protein
MEALNNREATNTFGRSPKEELFTLLKNNVYPASPVDDCAERLRKIPQDAAQFSASVEPLINNEVNDYPEKMKKFSGAKKKSKAKISPSETSKRPG